MNGINGTAHMLYRLDPLTGLASSKVLKRVLFPQLLLGVVGFAQYCPIGVAWPLGEKPSRYMILNPWVTISWRDFVNRSSEDNS